MDVIEKWRINMGNLTNFYIGAHSYGAYLFGTYASLYPQHVRKLVLLSPLGVKGAPEDFSISRMVFKTKKGRGPPKWAIPIIRATWGHFSPISLLRLLTEDYSREVINYYLERNRTTNLTDAEKAVNAELVFQIMLREEST